MASIPLDLDLDDGRGAFLGARTRLYPRLRYMGSKYRVIPHLAAVLSGLRFDTVLDAFSGSGVVGYALKEMGKRVTTNDFLHFPATVARAVVENPGVRLEDEDVELLLSPNRDGRDFIASTFDGLYFPREDHLFLDAAWSHLATLPPYKRDLAVSALCLAAARKQPRGVFTVTTFRYDDGRRTLRLPLRDLFVEAVRDYNRVVFDNGHRNSARCGDVFQTDAAGFDLVYLDPPYAPPRDDNDYIKRYHFLEGLSVYWAGQTILEDTITKKIRKKPTPFGSKRTISDALERLVAHFRDSTLVLSYSSNSVPAAPEIREILSGVKPAVEMIRVPHRYSFGTHSRAARRAVDEYIFVAE